MMIEICYHLGYDLTNLMKIKHGHRQAVGSNRRDNAIVLDYMDFSSTIGDSCLNGVRNVCNP